MQNAFQKLRAQLNSWRLNYNSAVRKRKLHAETDKIKVAHLATTADCPAVWYGNSYGGFFINPTLLNKKSIVYSIGIGKDISFDTKCIKNHTCRIFAFDPTPKSIDWLKTQNLPATFSFYNYGISAKTSGPVTFYLPMNKNGTSGSMLKTDAVNANENITVMMKTFSDITTELGHTHVDVLKMDIEGAEYDVLAAILDSPVTIDQILVEFHDRLFDMSVFKSKEITEKLKEQGYHIFAVSSSYEEVSFIHNRVL